MSGDDRVRAPQGWFETFTANCRPQPAIPAMLMMDAPMTISSRLEFAKWLVGPDNPLTARVTVNRFWRLVFGRGLVRTLEDFGAQGAPPTHPQLLDWLAVEFQGGGWRVKSLLRQLVTSATYRQDSRITAQQLAAIG